MDLLLKWGRSMFDLRSVNDILLKAMSRGEREVIRWQQPDGRWAPISAGELYGKVRALARSLQRLGVERGDRVVLIAENRWEWPVADFATLSLGAVDVPLYGTSTPEQLGYMLNDSGAKVAIVSTAEQYRKLQEAGELPALQHVLVMDDVTLEGVERFQAALEGWEPLQTRDAGFDEQLRSVNEDELATIIYTSGTTGQPKGVQLTHWNLASNVNVTTDDMGFTPEDSAISFLPLSHVTARHLDYAFLCHGALVAYCPKIDKLQEALQAVRPTIFLAVPRVYEKIRQSVESKASASPMKKRVLSWSIGVGERNRAAIAEGRTPRSITWRIASKLVYSKVAAAFGGRVKTFSAGGAPLGMDTAGWFADAGIRILEGYGMTETSPVIAVNTPKHYRLGSVGRPVPNLEVQFAQDGELEVRGPSVFKAYWNREKETAEAFDGEGWFRTGDIGKLEDGFLTITDRKKELLKTSGGKLIAPQPIENKLKANGLIAHAALVGDKRKFASVLISPNFQALNDWAKSKGIGTEDRAALVRNDKVNGEYRRLIEQVNQSLAHYETIKKITIVPDEWSVENGELTPSMKMKRRVVEEKYKGVIEGMYRGDADKGE